MEDSWKHLYNNQQQVASSGSAGSIMETAMDITVFFYLFDKLLATEHCLVK